MKNKICIGCKIIVYKTKQQRGIKWSSKKYCTHKCFLIYRKTNKGMKFPYKARPNQKRLLNEDNPAWKGNEVGYVAIHSWVKQRLGRAIYCSNDKDHKISVFVWANISGEYKRDLNDWHSLCTKCNLNDGIKVPERMQQRRYYAS